MTRLLSFRRLSLFALLIGGLSLGLVACDSGGSGMEEEEMVEVSVEGVVVDATGKDALLAKSGRPSQSAEENQDPSRDPETARPDGGQRPGDVSTRTDTLAEGDQRPQDAPKIEEQSARPLQEQGDPIEGAEVAIYLPNEDSPEATATTESDGSYDLTFSISEESVPEELVLEAKTDRFKTYTSTVDFNRSITYDVALEELDGYVASGQVVNEDGAGVEGVTVQLKNSEQSTTTGPNGQWEQGGLEGTVTVVPSKEKFEFEPANRQIDGETDDVDFSADYQPDPPEGAEADLELAENAKIADDHTAEQLLRYENGRLLFEKSTAFLENVEEGDIIAIKPEGEVDEDEFIWKVTGDPTGKALSKGGGVKSSQDGVELPVEFGGWFDLFGGETQKLNFDLALSALEWSFTDPLGELDIEQSSGEIRLNYDNLVFGESESGADLDFEVVDGEVVFDEPTLDVGLEIAPNDSWLKIEDFFLDANLGAEGFLEMKGEWNGDNETSIRFPINLVTEGAPELLKESVKELLGEYGGWIGEKLVEFLGAINPIVFDVFFDLEIDAESSFHTILQTEVAQTAEIDFQEEGSDANIDGTAEARLVCNSYSRSFEGQLAGGAAAGFYLTNPQGAQRGAEIGFSPSAVEVTAGQGSGGNLSIGVGPAFILKRSWPFERTRWIGPLVEVNTTLEGGPISYADAAFEEAVRAEIPVPSIESRENRTEDNCPLYPSDVDEITSLDASEQDVESVVGIEAMPKLSDADLSSSSLTKLDPLVDLAKSSANLTEVDLRDNPTLDTTPGSGAREAIETLKSEGVTVYYDEPEGTEATISGVVTDADTGDPIEGATVTGADADTGDELFDTETDGFGEYEATFTVNNEPSEVALQANAEGYEAAEETVPFSEEMTADLTLAPATGGEATIYTGSTDYEAHKLTPEGKQVWAYTGHSDKVFGVAVDADGYVYTASGTGGFADPGVVHRLTPEGEREWAYTGHSLVVYGVAVDADGYVYTASLDDEVHKLTPEGEREWAYTGHSRGVDGVAVDADGYVYTASSDGEVHKLTPEGEREWAYYGHSDEVVSVAVDAEGYVYTASDDNEVHKLTPEGEREWSYTGHSDRVFGVAVDAGGSVYTASDDNEVHKLTPDGEQVWAYAGHSKFVYGVAVDADGFVYTASSDDEVHKLTPEGEREWAYTGHSDRVFGVAVFPGAFWVSQGLVD